MKSKIRVELDDLNNPIIEITVPQNMDEEDLRDKVLTKFLNGAVYFEIERPTEPLFKGIEGNINKYILRPVKREQLHTPQVEEADHNYINLAYHYGAKGIFLNSPYKQGDVITYDYFSNKARNEDNQKIWYCSTKPCNGHIGAIIDCGAKMNMGTSGTSGRSCTSGTSGLSGTTGTSGTSGIYGTTGSSSEYRMGTYSGTGSRGTAGTSGTAAEHKRNRKTVNKTAARNNSYVLQPSDANSIITMNYEYSVTVYIPKSNEDTFPINTIIEFIQEGNGGINFQLDEDVKGNNNTPSTTLRGTSVELIKTGANEWLLVGKGITGTSGSSGLAGTMSMSDYLSINTKATSGTSGYAGT